MQTGNVALELRPGQEQTEAAIKVMPSSHGRLIRKLRDALREPICQGLEDTSGVEIMLNPDGRLFVERLGHGMEVLANREPAAAEIIIATVAYALQTQTDADQPVISAELPIGGRRFKGLLPPIVSAPSVDSPRPPRSAAVYVDSLRSIDGSSQILMSKASAFRSLNLAATRTTV